MKAIFLPWLTLKPALRHSLAAFEVTLADEFKRLLWILLGLVFFWHLYTPIHELLHVGACLLGGGTVESLALKPQYGGTLLAEIFPFIVPESDYAGQLTGFTTPNYWVYALVDFAPYALSLFGVALIEFCRKKKWAPLFGLAVILAYIPFMAVTGDYYEAVSLVTTQIAEALHPQWQAGVLISDDLFKSVADLRAAGRLDGGTIALLAAGLLGAIYLALLTLALQVKIAAGFHGPDIFEPSPNGGSEDATPDASPPS